MKDLENEIYKISEIFLGLLDKREHYEWFEEEDSDRKWFSEIMESVEKLSKDINFPNLKKFTEVYFKLICQIQVLNGMEGREILESSYGLISDILNLKKFFDDNRDKIIGITFKALNGKNLTLKDPAATDLFIRSGVDSFFRGRVYTEILKDKEFPTIPLKTGKLNKGFIRCLFPMFKHLKTHNPELNNTDIYVFLREFIILLGFDFESMYPNSVGDDEPFKSYFSDLK